MLSLFSSLVLMADVAAAPIPIALNGQTSGEPYQVGGKGYEPGGTAQGFLYSIALPDGNYRVTVKIGDRIFPSDTTVKAESRRLMLSHIKTRRGEFVTRSFLVNIRTPALTPPPDTAPGGTSVRLNMRERGSYSWDEKLTLEFLGTPTIHSISIARADVPTVYLVGDSTVTDQRYEPTASWGQMLPAMLDDRVAVANHAESGETLKSFITELRLDKALSAMKPGDWLFIQFGHNDQKAQWPQTYADPEHTYPAYLRAYIAEARRRGARPVLVTSPERRNFDARGEIRNTLEAYAAAMKRVALQEDVPLIDLHAASKRIYEALGPEKALIAFNDGGKDLTHHDNYGAWLLASAVAQGIRTQVPELGGHVTSPAFDPAHPPLPADVPIEPSLARSAQRPSGS